MKKSAEFTPAEGLRTWQEIGQQASTRELSTVAKRNRFVRQIGWGASMLLGLVILLLGVWAVRGARATPAHGSPATTNTSLDKVVFVSDGVLTEAWVRDFLHLHTGEPLKKYDVFTLQQRLLESKQVSTAVVERILPGTLRISIQERKPWLRVAADNGAGGFNVELVSRDGTVFEGQCYTDESLSQLPWLAGVTLHHSTDGGFGSISGIDAVADLLKTARASLPQLAAQWTEVDLKDYDPRPEAPVSLIKIQSTDLGQLVFLAKDFQTPTTDFQTQIDRLGFAVHTLRDKQMLIRGIDLSLQDQVVVEPVVQLAPARHTATH